MKNKITFALFVVFAMAIGYLLSKNDDDYDYEEWKKKIERYDFVQDSLLQIVDDINKRLYAKDSILLGYMQTLNRSLYELDREAGKDKAALNQNEKQQADMVKAFCENMADLNRPDFCK